MSETLYAFEDSEVALLKRLCADYKAGRLYKPSYVPPSKGGAIDCYYGVCNGWLPPGGYGEVFIYQFDKDSSGNPLAPSKYNPTNSIIVNVWNPYSTRIIGNVTMMRDPYSGVYVVTSPPILPDAAGELSNAFAINTQWVSVPFYAPTFNWNADTFTPQLSGSNTGTLLVNTTGLYQLSATVNLVFDGGNPSLTGHAGDQWFQSFAIGFNVNGIASPVVPAFAQSGPFCVAYTDSTNTVQYVAGVTTFDGIYISGCMVANVGTVPAYLCPAVCTGESRVTSKNYEVTGGDFSIVRLSDL